MRPDSLLLNMAPLRFFGSAKMRYVLAECCAWVFFLAPTSYRDRLVEDRQSSQSPLPNHRLTALLPSRLGHLSAGAFLTVLRNFFFVFASARSFYCLVFLAHAPRVDLKS